MTSASRYAKREKTIAAADADGIRERWEYGRLLLVDDTATTAAGNLRNGVLAELVRVSLRSAVLRSATSQYAGLRREIQYRLQCARAYPFESQITQASAQYGYWWQLIRAGFPPYPSEADERPYDPRSTQEIRRDLERSGHGIMPEPWQQRALFERFSDDDTLAALQRYAEEQSELTARYQARCVERHAYLTELIKAVNGDLSRTYGEAKAALEASPDEPGALEASA